MARRTKLYAAMKSNPQGDWTIANVASLSRAFGISCEAPTRGSHYMLSHPQVSGKLPIPARKPIKAVYIRLLIDMIDSLEL